MEDINLQDFVQNIRFKQKEFKKQVINHKTSIKIKEYNENLQKSQELEELQYQQQQQYVQNNDDEHDEEEDINELEYQQAEYLEEDFKSDDTYDGQNNNINYQQQYFSNNNNNNMNLSNQYSQSYNQEYSNNKMARSQIQNGQTDIKKPSKKKKQQQQYQDHLSQQQKLLQMQQQMLLQQQQQQKQKKKGKKQLQRDISQGKSTKQLAKIDNFGIDMNNDLGFYTPKISQKQKQHKNNNKQSGDEFVAQIKQHLMYNDPQYFDNNKSQQQQSYENVHNKFMKFNNNMNEIQEYLNNNTLPSNSKSVRNSKLQNSRNNLLSGYEEDVNIKNSFNISSDITAKKSANKKRSTHSQHKNNNGNSQSQYVSNKQQLQQQQQSSSYNNFNNSPNFGNNMNEPINNLSQINYNSNNSQIGQFSTFFNGLENIPKHSQTKPVSRSASKSPNRMVGKSKSKRKDNNSSSPMIQAKKMNKTKSSLNFLSNLNSDSDNNNQVQKKQQKQKQLQKQQQQQFSSYQEYLGSNNNNMNGNNQGNYFSNINISNGVNNENNIINGQIKQKMIEDSELVRQLRQEIKELRDANNGQDQDIKDYKVTLDLVSRKLKKTQLELDWQKTKNAQINLLYSELQKEKARNQQDKIEKRKLKEKFLKLVEFLQKLYNDESSQEIQNENMIEGLQLQNHKLREMLNIHIQGLMVSKIEANVSQGELETSQDPSEDIQNRQSYNGQSKEDYIQQLRQMAEDRREETRKKEQQQQQNFQFSIPVQNKDGLDIDLIDTKNISSQFSQNNNDNNQNSINNNNGDDNEELDTMKVKIID